MAKMSMKYLISITTLIACLVVPLAGYAAIGIESSNKSAETGYPLMASATGPSYYPGMYLGGSGDAGALPPMFMPPSASLSPYPSYGDLPPAGNMPGGMYPPYPSSSGNMPGVGMYPPYPSSSGNMPGGMLPPYSYEMPPMYPDPSSQPSGYPPMPGYPYPQQQYGSADLVYNQAMQAFRNRDYWTAMAKFQEVAMYYPQSDLADNAHYWIGEIYYTGKNFPSAIQAYQTVLYSYPQGNKVPDAHVKMGFAYAEMRQYSMARSILQEVAARYSNNTRIRNLATKKLNELNNMY